MQMLRLDTQAQANRLELVRTGGILSTRHAGGQVIRDDHRDRTMIIDRVQQTRHTAMRKGRITYDRHGRE